MRLCLALYVARGALCAVMQVSSIENEKYQPGTTHARVTPGPDWNEKNGTATKGQPRLELDDYAGFKSENRSTTT